MLKAALLGAVLAAVGTLAGSSMSMAHMALIRQGDETIDIPEPDDRLGMAVAAGDFNGDGYEDLASAAPFESEDPLDTAQHGSVIITYGSFFGISHLGADFLTVGDVVDQNVQFGRSLAVGDFNGDGIDDLAVGAPYDDGPSSGTWTDAGAVYIFHGDSSGLYNLPEAVLYEDVAGGTIEDIDRFGWSLAAGDFDGNGVDDLAIGVIGEDFGAGAVCHLFGAAGVGLDFFPGCIRQSDLGQTNEVDSYFGFALTAADYDGDGYDDLAVGAPQRTLGDGVQSGRVYIIPGAVAGFALATAVYQDADVMGLPHDEQDRFGHSLCSGSFSPFGATNRSLAVGEPWADYGTEDKAGRVTVIKDPMVGSWPVRLYQNTGGTKTPEASDQFGYAVAAGDFNNDGFDDLGVGSPFEDVDFAGSTISDAGLLQIFPGGATFWLGTDASAYTARSLNDEIVRAWLGYAVTFGYFDASDSANVAIGAPMRYYPDYNGLGSGAVDAGQVHILAPHRQMRTRQNRSSIAIDCDGNIIYSQRLFQHLHIASTTKVMTALIACEAIQNGDVEDDYVYTVPDWVANNVGGSQAGLAAGEKIEFQNLIGLMICFSGNDAAYAIGDILTGEDNVWDPDEDGNTNLELILSDFADMMNARAGLIGMETTNFTNPAGLDLGNHFSSAYDMYLLSEEAMQNDLFRTLIDAGAKWIFTRDHPGTANDTTWTFSYAWLKGLQSLYSDADGVKPGGTPVARFTRVASALLGKGRIHATAFGIMATRYGDPVTDDADRTVRDLLMLAENACGAVPPGGGRDTVPSGEPVPPLIAVSGASTFNDDTPQGAMVAVPDDFDDDLTIELAADITVGGEAQVALIVARQSGVLIAANDAWETGFSPYVRHGEITLSNIGATAAQILLDLTHPPSSTPHTIEPESTLVIPANQRQGAEPAQFAMTIINTGGEAADLEIEETGYAADVELLLGAPPAAFVLSRTNWNTRPSWETFRAAVAGQDGVPGNTVSFVIRAAGSPAVSVPGPVTEGPLVSALGQASFPNPFREATEIRYDLPEASPISVKVYDLTGRLVRELESSTRMPAGRRSTIWDGRDANGRPASTGVYFYRVDTGRLHGSGKITLLR